MDAIVKTCALCGETKPLEAFHRQPTGKFGRHSYCAVCACAKQQESRIRNYTPEQKRKWQLQTRYGLTPEQVEAMIEQQDGGCKICGIHLTRPHVDHCHNTGDVRGILCQRCNTRLGGWDDLEWREKAAAYLGIIPEAA